MIETAPREYASVTSSRFRAAASAAWRVSSLPALEAPMLCSAARTRCSTRCASAARCVSSRSSSTLARARSAVYPTGCLRDLPEGWRDRAFQPVDGEYRLRERYRAGVRLWYPFEDFLAYRQLSREQRLTFRQWLRSIAHAKMLPHFSWRDPLPTLVRECSRIWDAAANRLGRVFRRH